MDKVLTRKIAAVGILVAGMSGFTVAAETVQYGSCQYSHKNKVGVFAVVPNVTKQECETMAPPPHNHFSLILVDDPDLNSTLEAKDSDQAAHSHHHEAHSHTHQNKSAENKKKLKPNDPPIILSVHERDFIPYGDNNG